MTKSSGDPLQEKSGKTDTSPFLNIAKIGIVSRDYRHRYDNGYRDFSLTLPAVLNLLDYKGCDAVLFSLFSIIPRKSYDPRVAFREFKNIKAVFLEEFQDGKKRKACRYVIYHMTKQGWCEYEFYQAFGSLTGKTNKDIDNFVTDELPKRILGNYCVLLCGETNGVKYSPKDKKVKDFFGLRAAIPQKTNIVLNPIHDRMTRFEMKMKRKFLSEKGRWVVSVWNKGKSDKNGKVRDGNNPAWTVFHNGKEYIVDPIPNQLGVEICILNFKKV